MKTRRDFLKKAALFGASAFTAPSLLGQERYGAQNETYIEGWEKKTSNLLIYKRLCKV